VRRQVQVKHEARLGHFHARHFGGLEDVERPHVGAFACKPNCSPVAGRAKPVLVHGHPPQLPRLARHPHFGVKLASLPEVAREPKPVRRGLNVVQVWAAEVQGAAAAAAASFRGYRARNRVHPQLRPHSVKATRTRHGFSQGLFSRLKSNMAAAASVAAAAATSLKSEKAPPRAPPSFSFSTTT